MERRRRHATDFLCIATLVATAAVIAQPILAGGYRTYLDNPPHLAEIYSLARDGGNGWSDIAFCGFPIGYLHSPLWYGGLAALDRAGLAIEPLYALLLMTAFAAPSVALYLVSRRFLSPLPATLLAYVLLVQRPAIVGIGSALGGMWTFYLAAAAVILLASRLSRSVGSGRDFIWIAGLVGFTALTHLFAVVPAGLLVASHLLRCLLRDRSLSRELLTAAAAGAFGLLSAAVYWLPMMLVGEHSVIRGGNVWFHKALARLLLPSDMLARSGWERVPSDLFYTDAVPMLLLAAAGAGGALLFKRFKRGDLPLYGCALAALTFFLVGIAAPILKLPLPGPMGWRLLYFVRIGLGLAALPLLLRIAPRLAALRTRTKILAAVLAIAAGAWWGRPLALVTPPEQRDLAAVGAIWDWLREHHTNDWGRVYLQDTFYTPPRDTQLNTSHLLALTAAETGVRQLGPYYGVVPFKTQALVRSEFGNLFSQAARSNSQLETLPARMALTNSTHLVLADPLVSKRLKASLGYEMLYQSGRFSVLRRPDPISRWVDASTSMGIEVERFEAGCIVLETRADSAGGDLLVKTAYHPWWSLRDKRVREMPDVRIASDADGLMTISAIPAGSHRLELEYRPARFPLWITIGCWGILLALALRGRSAKSADPPGAPERSLSEGRFDAARGPLRAALR